MNYFLTPTMLNTGFKYTTYKENWAHNIVDTEVLVLISLSSPLLQMSMIVVHLFGLPYSVEIVKWWGNRAKVRNFQCKNSSPHWLTEFHCGWCYFYIVLSIKYFLKKASKYLRNINYYHFSNFVLVPEWCVYFSSPTHNH